MDFILKVVLPSSCGIVVGIGLVVGLCIGLCSECPDRLAVGIGPGVPLVLCLNPCCSVGIILVHWKILKGHKVDRERKDGGAQYPLKKKPGDKTDSAGSEVHKGQGQDEGRQRGPRHGHSEGNWPRPQPAGGESSQPHDGPKNKETTFKPRRLPEIPPADNKSRGLSANFDEVLPEKKRLTPLGQEAKESYEERPRKKKKKKKKNEADDDSEY